MSKRLIAVLAGWPRAYIRDADLAVELPGSDASRYSLVRRAMEEGLLIRLKRGLYLIGSPLQKAEPNLFEMAQQIYSPSAISLESALSFHGWIPEAVYTICSVTPKKGRSYETPAGLFAFHHSPLKGFYEGVERQTNPVILMASPWKAVADLIYVRRPKWKDIAGLTGDLRVERQMIDESDLSILQTLAENYSSSRVRELLATLYGELAR